MTAPRQTGMRSIRTGSGNGGTKTDPKPSPSITDSKPSNTGTSGNGTTGERSRASRREAAQTARPPGGDRVQASGSITAGGSSSGGIRRMTTGGRGTNVRDRRVSSAASPGRPGIMRRLRVKACPSRAQSRRI